MENQRLSSHHYTKKKILQTLDSYIPLQTVKLHDTVPAPFPTYLFLYSCLTNICDAFIFTKNYDVDFNFRDEVVFHESAAELFSLCFRIVKTVGEFLNYLFSLKAVPNVLIAHLFDIETRTSNVTL